MTSPSTPLERPASPTSPFAGRWLELLLLLSGGAFVFIGTRAHGTPLVAGIVIFAVVILAAGFRRSAAERRVLAASGGLVLVLAIPINRLVGVTPVIVTVTLVLLALTLSALQQSNASLPIGWLTAVVLLVVLGFVTALSQDQSPLLRFAPFLCSFSCGYLVMGQSGVLERARILRVFVTFAVAEGLLAIAEPFAGSPQLWAPAQLNVFGEPTTLLNPLFSSLARSQGTLGHPLPLGIVLAAGIAVLVRATGLSLRVRLLALVPLLGGLVFSGSRNSIGIALITCAFFAFGRLTPLRAIIATLSLTLGAGMAVAGGYFQAAAVTDFAASGSVTHRSGAFDAFIRLLADQDVVHLFTGNGWASTARLFKLGLLQTDGFGAVDNEIVLLLAQGGLACVILLVALLVRAAVNSPMQYRPLLLALVVTLFVFDLLLWPSSALLFGIALGAALTRDRSELEEKQHQRGVAMVPVAIP